MCSKLSRNFSQTEALRGRHYFVWFSVSFLSLGCAQLKSWSVIDGQKALDLKGRSRKWCCTGKRTSYCFPCHRFFWFFFSTCMMPSFCFFIGRSDICKYVHNVWSHISKSEFPLADVISSFFSVLSILIFPGGRDRSILFSARYFLTGLPVQNLSCQFLNKGTCLAKASGKRNLPT